MDFTVTEGDRLLVWWPNGAGYDLYEIKHGVSDTIFKLIGQFEVTASGNYVKVE